MTTVTAYKTMLQKRRLNVDKTNKRLKAVAGAAAKLLDIYSSRVNGSRVFQAAPIAPLGNAWENLHSLLRVIGVDEFENFGVEVFGDIGVSTIGGGSVSGLSSYAMVSDAHIYRGTSLADDLAANYVRRAYRLFNVGLFANITRIDAISKFKQQCDLIGAAGDYALIDLKNLAPIQWRRGGAYRALEVASVPLGDAILHRAGQGGGYVVRGDDVASADLTYLSYAAGDAAAGQSWVVTPLAVKEKAFVSAWAVPPLAVSIADYPLPSDAGNYALDDGSMPQPYAVLQRVYISHKLPNGAGAGLPVRTVDRVLSVTGLTYTKTQAVEFFNSGALNNEFCTLIRLADFAIVQTRLGAVFSDVVASPLARLDYSILAPLNVVNHFYYGVVAEHSGIVVKSVDISAALVDDYWCTLESGRSGAQIGQLAERSFSGVELKNSRFVIGYVKSNGARVPAVGSPIEDYYQSEGAALAAGGVDAVGVFGRELTIDWNINGQVVVTPTPTPTNDSQIYALVVDGILHESTGGNGQGVILQSLPRVARQTELVTQAAAVLRFSDMFGLGVGVGQGSRWLVRLSDFAVIQSKIGGVFSQVVDVPVPRPDYSQLTVTGVDSMGYVLPSAAVNLKLVTDLWCYLDSGETVGQFAQRSAAGVTNLASVPCYFYSVYDDVEDVNVKTPLEGSPIESYFPSFEAAESAADSAGAVGYEVSERYTLWSEVKA